MISIKLRNHTTWCTKELRVLFLLIAKNEGFIPSTVEIGYSDRLRGYTYINGTFIKMFIPNFHYRVEENNGKKEMNKYRVIEIDNKTVREIAQIFAHEIGHDRGLIHREMMHDSKIDVSYIPNDFIIHRKLKKKKERDVILQRYNHAVFKLNKAEKRLAQAKRLVKKWDMKKKYYEKKYPTKFN